MENLGYGIIFLYIAGFVYSFVVDVELATSFAEGAKGAIPFALGLIAVGRLGGIRDSIKKIEGQLTNHGEEKEKIG